MKVVVVLGSPHVHGNSETLAEWVIRGAKDAGHQVVTYRLNELNIQGCQACGRCKREGIDCVLRDDLAAYWEDLHSCDALILAAPNYCSQVSGPMITYMNRHYCLIGKNETGFYLRIHEGIRLIGIFSQGGPRNERADAAYDWFLSDFQARGMVLRDKIVHTGQDSTSEGSELARRAYLAGKNL